MEFDIGTLLYIVVTIVAIIAGVSGKKKKPAAPQEGSGESSGEGFFDRLEQQLSGFTGEEEEAGLAERVEAESEREIWHEEDEVSFRETVEAERESSREKPGRFEGVYNPEMQENLDLIRAEAERSTEAIEVLDLDDTGDHPDYFEIVKDFDLGTAVIYSAIINRREY